MDADYVDGRAVMYDRGVVVYHTSDEDGGSPDVGISVGLGGGVMLYAGEVQGPRKWSVVLYTLGGRIDVAECLDRDAAVEMVKLLGAALRGAM